MADHDGRRRGGSAHAELVEKARERVQSGGQAVSTCPAMTAYMPPHVRNCCGIFSNFLATMPKNCFGCFLELFWNFVGALGKGYDLTISFFDFFGTI